MTFDAYHLPLIRAGADVIVLEREQLRAVAPRLSGQDVRDVCARLRAARANLVQLPLAHIIDAIDQTAQRLRDPRQTGYDELIDGIAAFTGYSRPMAEHVLERMSADWLATPLQRLVDDELGGPTAVDSFTDRAGGTRTRAVAPPLTLHIFSGNVPGVSVTSLVRALLVKSAVFGKTAAGEPLLAARFARMLHDVEPVIGACVAVTYWSGGDVATESAALDSVDAVIHYGSEAAIESLRTRAPASLRFIEHGPRASLAILNGALLRHDHDHRAAHDLARAVALFDQQGCVSPQVAYVVGSEHTARAFAARVASALDDVQRELPRGRLDPAEAAAVRELRTSAEFRSIRGENVELWTGANLAWTVVLEPGPASVGNCLHRTLVVRHAPSIDDVMAQLRPIRTYLQTIGTAGFDGAELVQLATAAAELGATRICPIADMPWPPVTWHHDGRGPLRELVRWVDLET